MRWEVRLRDPTGISDFMVFHGERSTKDCGDCGAETHRIARTVQDTRETDDEETERWTKDGEEEKGGRSYVSPPPEVGGPRNRLRGWSAIRPTVSVRVPDVRSSRLASASASSNPWTNLCGRDGGFSFASLNPSSVHRRVSPLGRSVGHRSLPDSPVPPRRRVSRPRGVHSMSRGRDRIRDDTASQFTSRPR